jgi:hypothetical protein
LFVALTICRGFSPSRRNSLSRRGQRERLWSKILSNTSSGCLADSGVNEKRLRMGLAFDFRPSSAVVSPATPVFRPLLRKPRQPPIVADRSEPRSQSALNFRAVTWQNRSCLSPFGPRVFLLQAGSDDCSKETFSNLGHRQQVP